MGAVAPTAPGNNQNGKSKAPMQLGIMSLTGFLLPGKVLEMLCDAFVKCGLTANPDGSDTHLPGVLARQKAVESDEEDGSA